MTHSPTFHQLGRALMASLVWLLASCGGGGSSNTPPSPAVTVPPGANVQALRVGPGPAGSGRVVNLLYTSVRLCVPGSTTSCQTIDNVLVDTGSTGLRLLSAAVSLPLPLVKVSDKQLYNCVQFIDQSYMWGPVATADVYLGGSALDGEKAASLRIQLAGTAGAAAAPSVCASTGFTPITAVSDLGANGILGIGPDREDCGIGCEFITNNGYYHLDQGGGVFAGTAISRAEQLLQPVSRFAVNNNGTLISLPTIPSTGAASATGAMIFGIGTQANNVPGTVSKMAPNASGYFTTTFDGGTLIQGFVDSGSNGWFFGLDNDPAFPTCVGIATDWYCPTSTLTLQAVNSSVNGQTSTVNFSIANAIALFSNASIYAMSNLGGPIGDDDSFDFGLPFFYGRQVYTAISGANTPLGSGPYVAY